MKEPHLVIETKSESNYKTKLFIVCDSEKDINKTYAGEPNHVKKHIDRR